MKTSFYFVLWILIYPFLGLFHNAFINANSFIIAFLLVWILSSFLNKSMPDILSYEYKVRGMPMLEDIYSGNLIRFLKNLQRDMIIRIVTAAYFFLSTVMIVLMMIIYHSYDWIALLIFVFIDFSVGRATIMYMRSYEYLKRNLSENSCAEIARGLYKIDYSSYKENRQLRSYGDMYRPMPRHFEAFRNFSIIVALICTVLGLLSIVISIGNMMGNGRFHLGDLFSSVMILYGSLAIYYGLKDLISCLQTKVA